MNKFTTCLWFDGQALAAAKFYCSVFKKSKLGTISHYDKTFAKKTGQSAGSIMVVDFTLNGDQFIALNGGPLYKFTPAVSLIVSVKTQKELDYYWKRLTSGGGEPVQCGWLKDKYGMSWQIVPAIMEKAMRGKNKTAYYRMVSALTGMVKLDVAKLEKAFRG